jgi:hypothetical protein
MPKTRDLYRYENRILEIVPDDGSRIKSKDFLNLAIQPYAEKKTDGIIVQRPGMSLTTVYYYLNSLIEKEIVKKWDKSVDPTIKSPKDVFYTKSQDFKAGQVHLSEEIVKEKISLLVKETLKEVGNTANFEIFAIRKNEKDLSKDDSKGIFSEITRSDFEMERALARVLVKQGIILFKQTQRNGRKDDFYIDSEGNTISKNLINKKISYVEQMKDRFGRSWRLDELREWRTEKRKKQKVQHPNDKSALS